MTDELPTVALEPDKAWSLLSNVRRRRTIVIVDEAASELHVTDLAEHVAAYELGIDVDDVARQQWRRVYTALVSTHLSPLSQRGAIDYDVDEKTIAPAAATGDLAAWVRALNTAADVGDDLPSARCDAREGGPIVLE